MGSDEAPTATNFCMQRHIESASCESSPSNYREALAIMTYDGTPEDSIEASHRRYEVPKQLQSRQEEQRQRTETQYTTQSHEDLGIPLSVRLDRTSSGKDLAAEQMKFIAEK